MRKCDWCARDSLCTMDERRKCYEDDWYHFSLEKVAEEPRQRKYPYVRYIGKCYNCHRDLYDDCNIYEAHIGGAILALCGNCCRKVCG